MPPLGGSLSEYATSTAKTRVRVMWLHDGEKSLICLAVSTEYWRVTDRQTDILQQHSQCYVVKMLCHCQ